MSDARGRSWWPYALATVVLFLGFAAVWVLAGLVLGFGTCGEDSDITAAEYERLCENDGVIVRNLLIIATAALIVTIGLGAVAIRRRAARPVLVLTGLLTLAGAASLAADRL